MAPTRTPEEVGRILLFNCAFFGTLAWLGSVALVANQDGWWYELGQVALALAGIVLFWVAWWWDQRGHTRNAIHTAVPAVAVLSLWLTSVHAVLL